MKRMRFVLTCGVLALSCLCGQAQQRPAGRIPAMTPERMAAGRTEYLTRELKLDDRQAKKVYKIYLKQAEKLLGGMESRSFGEMGGRPPMGGPGGGMGPGRDTGPVPGGPGMREGRPSGPGPQGMAVPPAEESEKELAARDRKMKKILSADQYAEWRRLESRMEERRMRGMNVRPGEGMPEPPTRPEKAE